MSTMRICAVIGLVIGVVWAFTGIAGAFVTVVMTAVGAGVGFGLSRGVVDLGALVGRRDDD